MRVLRLPLRLAPLAQGSLRMTLFSYSQADFFLTNRGVCGGLKGGEGRWLGWCGFLFGAFHHLLQEEADGALWVDGNFVDVGFWGEDA